MNSRVGTSVTNEEQEQPGRSRGICNSRWFAMSKGWSLHAEVLFLLLVRILCCSGRLNVTWVFSDSVCVCKQLFVAVHRKMQSWWNPAVFLQHYTDHSVICFLPNQNLPLCCQTLPVTVTDALVTTYLGFQTFCHLTSLAFLWTTESLGPVIQFHEFPHKTIIAWAQPVSLFPFSKHRLHIFSELVEIELWIGRKANE